MRPSGSIRETRSPQHISHRTTDLLPQQNVDGDQMEEGLGFLPVHLGLLLRERALPRASPCVRPLLSELQMGHGTRLCSAGSGRQARGPRRRDRKMAVGAASSICPSPTAKPTSAHLRDGLSRDLHLLGGGRGRGKGQASCLGHFSLSLEYYSHPVACPVLRAFSGMQ